MVHELECNVCHHEFQLDEDYQSGDCPKCGVGHYFWDYVLAEEEDGSMEEMFQGYYWSGERY